MDFFNNLLRYPRFFLSSMVGLVLVLATPFLQLSKELKTKKIFLVFLFLGGLGLFSILYFMVYPLD